MVPFVRMPENMNVYPFTLRFLKLASDAMKHTFLNELARVSILHMYNLTDLSGFKF